jgi:large subunit ribosomal protein L20
MELCNTRIEAASYENGYNAYNLHDTLARCHIQLNRKVKANMAIWEPRTFRSIAAIAAFKENQPYSEGGYQANQPGPGIDVLTDGKL